MPNTPGYQTVETDNGPQEVPINPTREANPTAFPGIGFGPGGHTFPTYTKDGVDIKPGDSNYAATFADEAAKNPEHPLYKEAVSGSVKATAGGAIQWQIRQSALIAQPTNTRRTEDNAKEAAAHGLDSEEHVLPTLTIAGKELKPGPDGSISKEYADVYNAKVNKETADTKAKFVADNVQLPTGEYVSKDTLAKLPKDKAEYLIKNGVKAFRQNEAQELTNFTNKNVQLSNGEFVSKEKISKLTPEQAQYLIAKGVTAYNSKYAGKKDTTGFIPAPGTGYPIQSFADDPASKEADRFWSAPIASIVYSKPTDAEIVSYRADDAAPLPGIRYEAPDYKAKEGEVAVQYTRQDAVFDTINAVNNAYLAITFPNTLIRIVDATSKAPAKLAALKANVKLAMDSYMAKAKNISLGEVGEAFGAPPRPVVLASVEAPTGLEGAVSQLAPVVKAVDTSPVVLDKYEMPHYLEAADKMPGLTPEQWKAMDWAARRYGWDNYIEQLTANPYNPPPVAKAPTVAASAGAAKLQAEVNAAEYAKWIAATEQMKAMQVWPTTEPPPSIPLTLPILFPNLGDTAKPLAGTPEEIAAAIRFNILLEDVEIQAKVDYLKSQGYTDKQITMMPANQFANIKIETVTANPTTARGKAYVPNLVMGETAGSEGRSYTQFKLDQADIKVEEITAKVLQSEAAAAEFKRGIANARVIYEKTKSPQQASLIKSWEATLPVVERQTLKAKQELEQAQEAKRELAKTVALEKTQGISVVKGRLNPYEGNEAVIKSITSGERTIGIADNALSEKELKLIKGSGLKTLKFISPKYGEQTIVFNPSTPTGEITNLVNAYNSVGGDILSNVNLGKALQYTDDDIKAYLKDMAINWREMGFTSPPWSLSDVKEFYSLSTATTEAESHTTEAKVAADTVKAATVASSMPKLKSVIDKLNLALSKGQITPSQYNEQIAKLQEAPNTNTAVKNAVQALNATIAANQTGTATRAAVSSEVQTGAGTETQTNTETATQTVTGVQTATLPATKTDEVTSTKPDEVTSTKPDEEVKEQGKIQVKLPKKNKQEEGTVVLPSMEGAVAWKQGELAGKPVYHVLTRPYASQADIVTVVGSIPPGAVLATGKGSAFRTAKILRGKGPGNVTVDMGNQDVNITTVGGNRVALRFTPDPHGLTHYPIHVGNPKPPSPKRPKFATDSRKIGRQYYTPVGGMVVVSRHPLKRTRRG